MDGNDYERLSIDRDRRFLEVDRRLNNLETKMDKTQATLSEYTGIMKGVGKTSALIGAVIGGLVTLVGFFARFFLTGTVH